MKTGENVVPPPVGGDSAKNVIVVGGGVNGVLTTFELARSGHKVTLVEMRGLGNGSSQRSAACIRQQFDTASTVRGMVYSTRFFENWAEITGMLDDPIVQNGYLFLYDWKISPDAIANRVVMQQSAGLQDVEFLGRDEIDVLFPYVNTVGITCATWCPTDGFLHPHIIYNDGAEAAKAFGATIMTNSQVVGAVHDSGNGKITAVRVKKGGDIVTLPADIVVNATGVWGGMVSEKLGGISIPIQALRRYLYFIAGIGRNPLFMSEDDFRQCPMIIGPNGAYSHPTPSGELMMGWLNHAIPEDPDLADLEHLDSGFGTGNTHGYASAMAQEVARWLPEVADRRVSSGTCGFYEVMPDHNPVIDIDPKVSNLIHAVGFSGHGLMHAPFTARAVAELVVSGRSLGSIQLPLGLGEVNMSVYHATRDFNANHESMHI